MKGAVRVNGQSCIPWRYNKQSILYRADQKLSYVCEIKLTCQKMVKSRIIVFFLLFRRRLLTHLELQYILTIHKSEPFIGNKRTK